MSESAQSSDSLIGLEFSHYRIVEEIGSGRMGVIFRAHDRHLDREVAIKAPRPRANVDVDRPSGESERERSQANGSPA